MNDRQIECFLEAGRLLNFTRAAENLTLPQPAVSRYISALEDELGCRLFIRDNNRRLELTEAGKLYFNLFQRTSIELQHAKQTLQNSTPILRLGVNHSWSAASFLPEVVRECTRRNPDFRITYECADFRTLTNALQNERIDAVIALENYLVDAGIFEVEHFTSVQRMVLYSENLPGYKSIKTPSDFYPYDFLLADDPVIYKLVRQEEHLFRAYNFVPRFRTVPNIATVLHYIETGGGVALMDEWCYALHRPGMHYMNIDDEYRVGIAYRRSTGSSSVNLFRKVLTEHFTNKK